MAATKAANEELQLVIEEKLMKLHVEGLRELLKGFGLNESEWKDKSKMVLIKNMRKFMEEDMENLEAHEGRLKNVKQAIGTPGEIIPTLSTPVTSHTTSSTELASPVVSSSVLGGGLSTLTTAASSMLRRELKMFGQIGEPDQKDKLTYVSIHNYNVQGEIVAAVIRAMTPSLPLGKFLEASSSETITLPLLKKYLRSHIHEKSAQELYGELDSLTQKDSEDAMSFLFRAFELEAKICLAAEAEDASSFASKYPGMVRGLTLQTIETGLSRSNESIRNQLRPFLRMPKITADELTAQMRIIIAAEKSRNTKLAAVEHTTGPNTQKSKHQKNVSSMQRVSELPKQSEDTSTELIAAIKSLQTEVSNLSSLRSQVSSLQNEVKELRVNQGGEGKRSTRHVATCRDCASKGEP